jgi:hypothetical protein
MKKILLILSIFVLFSCGEEKKKPVPFKAPLETTETEPEAVAEPVVLETPEPVAEYKPYTTYWYVYYNTHIISSDNRYTGYTIIPLESPYFDVAIAVKALEPKATPEDFVGIQFFQQVQVETYKAFKKSNLK